MLHVPLTLDVSSQWLDHIWLMAKNSITVTGTLAHFYFLLSDFGAVSPVQSCGILHMKHGIIGQC